MGITGAQCQVIAQVIPVLLLVTAVPGGYMHELGKAVRGTHIMITGTLAWIFVSEFLAIYGASSGYKGFVWAFVIYLGVVWLATFLWVDLIRRLWGGPRSK